MADCSFPRTTYQALAMLYMQNQDISRLTPEELYDEYTNVLNRISQRVQETKDNQDDKADKEQQVFKFSRPM